MELTINDLKGLLSGQKESTPCETFLEIGKNYQIRTVTMIYTGKLVKESREALVLSEAAWVPETGRFSDSMKDTDLYNEVEPYHRDTVLYKGAFLDVVEIDKLPRGQK